MTKKEDATVKIDSQLLEEVEAFIKQEENSFQYVNKKQFINRAVAQLLQQEKRKKR